LRHDIEKQKKRRIKPAVVVIAALFVVALIVGTILLISHIMQQRAERKEHLSNAALHIENGIHNIIETTEVVIAFNMLIKQAESFAEISDYETAILTYETAVQVAVTIHYKEGIELADSGIIEMHKRIIAAKRNEAMNLFYTGEQYYKDSKYAEALEYFEKALEIYIELNDQQNIVLTKARIDFSELKLAEMEINNQEQPVADDDTQNDIEEPVETSPNYEHNLSINFDLRTLIDNQNQNPANQVRMGIRDGLNEGWYNG